MDKTLNKVQKISKAGLIISKIVLWCALIGAISCSLLLIIQLIVGSGKIVGDSSLVIEMIKDKSKLTIGSVYAGLVVGIIMAITKLIQAKLEVNYFTKELEVGTPFNMELVEQLKKLGIQAIVIPLVGVILSSVAYEIFRHYYPNIGELDLDNSASVSLGITYLIVSLICRLGAEKEN